MTTKLALACTLLFSVAAAAEPITLRVATVAPEGTGWAREFNAWARYVEAEAKGALRIKFYFGGVAGGELEIGDRIRRGQLDGAASGQFLCQQIAPSMAILRVPGVFQSRDEARDIVTRLLPTIDEEAGKNGFIVLGAAGLGPDVLFTRDPVRSLDDLKRQKLWRWDIDTIGIETARMMGLDVVPLPLYDARRAYDDKRVDGFMATPTAAIAFQWSSTARYVTDLHTGYLYGCLIFSQRSVQRLAPELQAALRAGSARMLIGVDELGRREDAKLLGGLLEKQGLTLVPVSPAFRSEYFETARRARDRIADKLVPRALLERVLRMLADYRIEHSQR